MQRLATSLRVNQIVTLPSGKMAKVIALEKDGISFVYMDNKGSKDSEQVIISRSLAAKLWGA